MLDSCSGILTTGGNCLDRQGRGFAQNGNGRPSVRQLADLIELDLLRQNIVNHGMEHIRVSFIKGANTLPHVDDLRGVTDTHVMITKQNPTNMFTLCVHLFPSFKCSLVSYKREIYLHIDYRVAIGLTMVGRDADIELHARLYVFDLDVLHQIIPYGDLDTACVGLSNGLLCMLPLKPNWKEIISPAELHKHRFRDVVAKCHVNPKWPKRRWKFINKPMV
jgi:hypothetical protein